MGVEPMDRMDRQPSLRAGREPQVGLRKDRRVVMGTGGHRLNGM